MSGFNTDLQYSLDTRKNDDFNKFYYRLWGEIKLIEPLDYSTNKQEQGRGIDKRIHLKSGRVITVEEKVRRVDYGDILLEAIANSNTKRRGWIYTCQSEFLMYFIEPSRKAYLFPVELLKMAWNHNKESWAKKYKRVEADNKNYKTISLAVPAEVLKEAIKQELQKNY